ncbi:MAG: BON domain-containing protein [Burkholderiales bacterium]
MRNLYLLFLLFSAAHLQACVPVIATGAATGGLVAADRRTPGTMLEDETIETRGVYEINKQLGDAVHVNVTGYNRRVLLTGEALTAEARQNVEAIVRSLPNTGEISNEVTVSGLSSLASRSNDTYLTSKVKGQMIYERKFQPNHVKVVTENGIVYLLGMVTQQEAQDAVEIARHTDGVERVVKLFEYLP